MGNLCVFMQTNNLNKKNGTMQINIYHVNLFQYYRLHKQKTMRLCGILDHMLKTIHEWN